VYKDPYPFTTQLFYKELSTFYYWTFVQHVNYV